MQSKKVELSTTQKVLLALAIVAVVIAVVMAASLGWTDPPCPTCHIERNSPGFGTRSDIGCFINGRISGEFAEGPVVGELNEVVVADSADLQTPIPGYLKNECVNIPVPCPPEKTPKLSFSLVGQSNVRWNNPLCEKGSPDCVPCKE